MQGFISWFGEAIATLEAWILALAGEFWVFPALYAFATIDGFFPPIPSESVVIALAALNRSVGYPALAPILLFAALGAFTGDQIAYQIGKTLQFRRLRIFRSARAQAALDWAERSLEKRGASFIIAARYVPVGRVAVNMTAGSLGFPRKRFVGLTAIAAVTWAIYSAVLGIVSGSVLKGHPFWAIVAGVIGGIILGIIIDRILHWFQQRRGGGPDHDGVPGVDSASDHDDGDVRARGAQPPSSDTAP